MSCLVHPASAPHAPESYLDMGRWNTWEREKNKTIQALSTNDYNLKTIENIPMNNATNRGTEFGYSKHLDQTNFIQFIPPSQSEKSGFEQYSKVAG